MTTIVCNRNIMAADRRGTSNPLFTMTKLFRVGGSIIGITGNIEQALRFVEWRRTPEAKPTFAEASSIEMSASPLKTNSMRWAPGRWRRWAQ